MSFALPNTVPVVAIGASAGGFETFSQFLRALPSPTGLAFVFIQHLDPNHHSVLPELLARVSAIPVIEARNGAKIFPNHVYVAPPNVQMKLRDGKLQLSSRPPGYTQHLPIDFFMRSLAEERKSRAIGVVLSGGASDGTLGQAAIKAEGGITFAQDPKSAKFDAMPRSAIASGCTDFILPPERIASELADIGRHPYLVHSDATAGEQPLLGEEYDKLFGLLYKATGTDFRQYKTATIHRRTLRRMAVLKLERIGDYVSYLTSHPPEIESLFQDLLIPVTSFFRDPEAFNRLTTKVFPAILKDKSNKGIVRIWAPGCSSGEETYSLAITLLEFLGDIPSRLEIQLFGTDLNERCIEKARAGMYPQSVSQEVSPERLRRFFAQVDHGYRISKSVRDLCVFARQNLIADPPFSQMNLIVCRNLLIYLTPSIQRKILPIFHYALKPSGFLMLGNSESITGFANLFDPVDKKQKILCKKAVATKLRYNISTTRYPKNIDAAAQKILPIVTKRAADLQTEADLIVLKRYAPVGTVISSDMEIIQFRGGVTPFLEPSPGKASLNLLKMARGGLAAELRSAVAEAKKKASPIKRKDIQFLHHGRNRFVTISVEPLHLSSRPEDRQYLVLFENAAPAATSSAALKIQGKRTVASGRKSPELLELQRKLVATEQQLHSIIESKEVTEEEFQSANEEILSANEELQSTNEELETSKEEQQSVNEELNTVNDELRTRNIELEQLSNDLNNLLSSTALPVVMADRALCIRRFTPSAAATFKLAPADIGRSVAHIGSYLRLPNFEELITGVMETLTSHYMELRLNEERWYSLQIRPYRTLDNKIDGAVIVLSDIDELKRASELNRKAKEFSQGIIDTVREPLLVLGSDLTVVYSNLAFSKVFRTGAEETRGKFLYRLSGGAWDIPTLRTLLEKVTSSGAPVQDFEVEHSFPDLGTKTMLLNARRIEDGHSDEPIMLVAIEDVTERTKAQRILTDTHAHLESLVEQRTAAVRELSLKLLRVQDEEHRTISRELHDSVGQNLALLQMDINELQKLRMPKKYTQLLARVSRALDNCLAETRTISHLLHPPLLDELGLRFAAKGYVKGFSERSGIKVNLQVPEDSPRLPRFLELPLFRVLQASLSNVHHHSQSPSVDVRLDIDERKALLEVKDYGRGMSRPVLETFLLTGVGVGVGLAGMRERLRELGGQLEIESGTTGTIVRATIPILRLAPEPRSNRATY